MTVNGINNQPPAIAPLPPWPGAVRESDTGSGPDTEDSVTISGSQGVAIPDTSPARRPSEEILSLLRVLYGTSSLPAEIEGSRQGICELFDEELARERIIDGQRVTGVIVIDKAFKNKLDSITGVRSTERAFDAAFGNQDGKLDGNDVYTLEGFIERLNLLNALFGNRQRVTQGQESFRAFLRRKRIHVMAANVTGAHANLINDIPGKINDQNSSFGFYLQEAKRAYVSLGRDRAEQEDRARMLESLIAEGRFDELPDMVWKLVFDALGQEFEYAALTNRLKMERRMDWSQVDESTGKTLQDDYYEGMVVRWINESRLPEWVTTRSIRETAAVVRAERGVSQAGQTAVPVQ